MANVCLENIKIMINKRVEELLLEPHCDFLPLLEFESASCDSSFLHTSENEKCPCVMGFEIQKRKERSSWLQEGAFKPIRELKNAD